MIVGVVLAGGRSQRMGGGDKALRDLAGRPMVSHVVARLAPQVYRVILNANGDVTRFAALGLPVVADATQDFAGPLAGMLAGMRWAMANDRHASHIVTVPGDAPFIPPDLVARLAKTTASASGAIAVAQSEGVLHHVTALWPVALAETLEAAVRRGERQVGNWAARQGIVAVPFDPVRIDGRTIDPFFNVNTHDDLTEADALKRLLQCSKGSP
jgi:molybdenum cofactor guanylyltransferase